MSQRSSSRSLRVLGVMTGTSSDGMDVACVEFSRKQWKSLWTKALPYPAELRQRVLAFQEPDSRHAVREILRLNVDLGEWYAKTLARVVRAAKKKPEVIANHGQTVAHFPEIGATLQLGDASRIAAATGLTTICRFREGDMAAGGEGAPLAPLFHRRLLEQLGLPSGVAIQNIGGIGNLTYLGKRGEILAFDTGPGNAWIDAATELATGGREHMDRGGKMATGVKPDENAVLELLSNPYFALKPPKSTGRDQFPFRMLTEVCPVWGPELISTATEVAARSIALAYQKWIIARKLPLSAIYVCGGGSKNPELMRRIQAALPGVEVSDLTQAGFDSRWIEAQAFAYFGYLSLLGEPLGGAWTGAKGFGPPGQIVPGKNWAAVVKKIARET